MALAGCGGGASGAMNCGAPVVPQLQMISPVSGSTGVLASIGSVTLTGNIASNLPVTVTLASASGAIVADAIAYNSASFTITVPGASAGSSPAPGLTPGAAVTYGAAIPALARGTTYTVTATAGTADPAAACPTSFTTNLGTFTTN
jgi:hypothetical protein